MKVAVFVRIALFILLTYLSGEASGQCKESNLVLLKFTATKGIICWSISISGVDWIAYPVKPSSITQKTKHA